MIRLDSRKPVIFDDGFSRRDFLHAGALSLLGLSLPRFFSLQAQGAINRSKDMNCIMIFLLGGPSHLDTWDLKPDAPAEIRGPYKPIKTNVTGIEISEIFPRMAMQCDKIAFLHGCHHDDAALHDTGHQLMQTGRLFQEGIEEPHIGSVLQKLRGARGDAPAHVLLPHPMGNTGGNMPHGQSAGYLGREYDPVVLNTDHISTVRRMMDGVVRKIENDPAASLMEDELHQAYTLISSSKMREAIDLSQEPEAVRDKYGRNRFGQSCLLARRMIERGVRFVTINMFESVFNQITWDIHGSAPFSSIGCYRDSVGPMFDNGYASLLEELAGRGLLSETLVMTTGEFGRTPKINPAGGRDHWPQCWTMFFAGGGVRGGQKIGSSDEIGAYPKDRPVSPAEVVATAYHALGVDLKTELVVEPDRTIKLVDEGVRPIEEMF
ncbi:MAG: DUF1501 domain-containing protein [Blastocatellia bacterium]|nr:DUF1501 domain-containing protein [Blastocatellia bacterium]